jgi:hypothetical protein
MCKWKINNGPAIIPEIIDGGEKLPHHDNPVIPALSREGEHVAIFLKSTSDDEKEDLREEIPGSIDTTFTAQFIEIKRETE